jgi:hypothetical protein
MIRLLLGFAFIFYATQFFSMPDPVPLQEHGDRLDDVIADQRDAGFVVEYNGLVKKLPDPSRHSLVIVGERRYRVFKSYNNHNTLQYFYFDSGNRLHEVSKYRFR